MEIILFAIGVFVYSLLFLALSPKARRISLGFIVVSFVGVFLTMITDSDIARALACSTISLALVFPFAIKDGLLSDEAENANEY